MRKSHLWLFLFLILFACGDRSSSFEKTADSTMLETEEYMDQIPRTAEPPPPPLAPEEDIADQKIRNSIEKGSKLIKDGRIKVEVADLKGTKAKLDSTLKAFKAYYENEDFGAGTYRSTYQLMIRVPTENFASLLRAIEIRDGKIIEKNISARDVTDQYVDVAIRLNNNKNYLAQYRVLLKRANSIKDILAIQEKIRVIEEEIDARSGRLKYIDDQVRFSTLRLELFEEHEVVAERKARNFGTQIVDAFKSGFDAFLDFLLFLVNIWPFILIGLLIWGFRKRIKWRFWRKDKSADEV